MRSVRMFVVGAVYLAYLALLIFMHFYDTAPLNMGVECLGISMVLLVTTTWLVCYKDLSRFQIFLPMVVSIAFSNGLFFIEPPERRWMWEFFLVSIFIMSIIAGSWWANLYLAFKTDEE